MCLIIGLAGACRRNELRQISINDIQDKENVLIITIPKTKTGNKRVFTITDEIIENISALQLIRKYLNLRPFNVHHQTFFINYRNGKCSSQVVGVHTFGKIPSHIAQYLQLPNANRYTGHAFRRSSASLLVETGADILMLKSHGGWKSNSVAEGYIEDSISRKNEISNRILTGGDGKTFEGTEGTSSLLFPAQNSSREFQSVGTVNSLPTNNVTSNNEENNMAVSNFMSESGITFSKCSKCTFNITINKKSN